MKAIIEYCIKNRKITIFIFATIAMIGVYSFFTLPRQEFPDATYPAVIVTVVYPGASAKDLNELVSSKIEEEFLEIDGYSNSKSVAKDSVAVSFIEFKLDVDKDKAVQDVRNRMSDLRGKLPKGITSISINSDVMKSSSVLLSISGYENSQLKDYSKKLKDYIIDVNGVKKVEIEGDVTKNLKVNVDFNKLNYLNISMDNLRDILLAQNVSMPSGEVYVDGEKIKISVNSTFEDVEEIKNTVVSVSKETGVVTTLKDIAEVYFENPKDSIIYKAGNKDALFISIFIEDSVNGVKVGKDIEKKIEEVSKSFPKDLAIENIFFGPHDIESTINLFLSNFIQGLILVVAVMIFALGTRKALTISLSLPLTISFTFLIMAILKVKIDQMSLVGLIIALGAIVDNSVVIGDSINEYLKQGLSTTEACVKGTKFSAIAILSATLTTVLSFLPLALIEGTAGQFVSPIAVVFITAIAISYIAAMFFVPSVASLTFKLEEEKKKIWFFKEFFLNSYTKLSKIKKRVVLAVVILFLIVFNFLMPTLQFFPYANKDFFVIVTEVEKKGDIDETIKIDSKIKQYLKNFKETKAVYSTIGSGMPKFFLTLVPSFKGADTTEIVYKFDLSDTNKTQSQFRDEIQKSLEENVAGASFRVNRVAFSEPGAPITMNIFGNSYEDIKKAKNIIKQEIVKLEGITEVSDNFGDDVFRYKINIDNQKALQAGITKFNVSENIFAYFNGINSGTFRTFGKEYDISLETNARYIEDLEKLVIKGSSGNSVLLKEIADFTIEPQTTVYNMQKFKKSATISANVKDGYSASKLSMVIKDDVLKKLDLPPVKIAFEGELENISKYFGSAIQAAVISILLIYLVLFIQFRSFVLPFIIVVTIPLSIMGSILGLDLMGKPLSLTALFGVIALSGIVVNNGILLIEYIEYERQNGATVFEACKNAVDRRFNAIMITAVTTILGFMPLAFSNDVLISPMACALMGGLMFSTLSTIFIIPMIYELIYTKRSK